MNDRMKELDSVRGIAVVLVIALHTFSRAAYFTENAILKSITKMTSVGWIGVDIFFTLSGFLITTILLRTRKDRHYFKNFYARRVLRIVPIYLALIFGVIAFAPKLEEEFTAHLPTVLPVLFAFQQNWVIIFWDFPLSTYLAVTWSLAIEEQFYFIWPLVVRNFSNETLLKAGGGYILLSILVRAVGVTFFDHVARMSIFDFFYFISFTRFEELLIGALLAILLMNDSLREKIRKYSVPVFLFFLSCFLAMVFTAPITSRPEHGYLPITVIGYTVIGLFTAGLIAAFATHPETALIRRLFQNRLLEFFGKYSYSMYLFHMPLVLILTETFWRAKMRGAEIYALLILLVFAGTTIIALLSWNLIEKHALSLKKYFEYD